MIFLAAFLGLYQMQAEQSQYNGEDLILSDAVSITHPIGRLSARNARLEHFQCGNSLTCQKFFLNGQVCIHTAPQYHGMNFFADRAEGVINTDSLFGLETLHLTGNVEISIGQGLSARGHLATYSMQKNGGGIISLFPQSPDVPCTLHLNESHCETASVIFDTITRQMTGKGPVYFFFKNADSQECFAVADELIYDTEKAIVRLTSQSPNRVLFWQENEKMRMSAPEIELSINTSTKQKTIRGIGNVQFYLTPQEETMIHNLFSKYL